MFFSFSRVKGLEDEISNMKVMKTRLEQDAGKKKEVLDSVTSTLTILEQENSKLLQVTSIALSKYV